MLEYMNVYHTNARAVSIREACVFCVKTVRTQLREKSFDSKSEPKIS